MRANDIIHNPALINADKNTPASKNHVLRERAGQENIADLCFSQQSGFGCQTGFPMGIQPKLTINEPGDKYEQEADAMADKVMRMEMPGETVGALPASAIQRKCAHCEEEEKKKLQRKETGVPTTAINNSLNTYVSSLNSGGQPLPPDLRNFYEPRFGYDFSKVKIHNDASAVQSAQSIHALAYTYGNNIVFNSGRYSPRTGEGKRLLGHELAHVVQQSGRQNSVQRACFAEDQPSRNISACPEGSQDVGRQAQGQSNRRDARANAIITTAQNASISIQNRALQVVNDMICAYMPSQVSKIRKITYYASENGLQVRSVGSGATTRADICVGDYFVNNTTNSGISRRLLQLTHEIQHIDQYRSGMAGANRSDEREFLAFYEEALADEFIGTGRMQHATRRGLIDGAIGYYYCLEASLKTRYSPNLRALLTRRSTVDGTAGNPSTDPPSACRRQ